MNATDPHHRFVSGRGQGGTRNGGGEALIRFGTDRLASLDRAAEGRQMSRNALLLELVDAEIGDQADPPPPAPDIDDDAPTRNISLRGLPAQIHRALTDYAAANGTSVNVAVRQLLAEALASKP